MEFGGASDGVLVSLQRATSLCDRGVEIVDGCEMSIDERLVDEGPKVLCRLQLRAVGGLEDQPDAVGNGEVFRTVPAGLVEYDNDDALAAGTGLPCEGFEQFGKERLVDAVREIPDGFSARRRDEGGDVEPFVAVMAECDRSLAEWCPDPSLDRFQADPMLIRRPELDRLAGMLVGFFGNRVRQAFLKSSVSSAVAEFGLCGRGDWIDQSIARSASQPRCGASFSSPS